MNLRAAYGMTLARPQVREIAPYRFYDFIQNRNISGNPDLLSTSVHNGELRWEWFYGLRDKSCKEISKGNADESKEDDDAARDCVTEATKTDLVAVSLYSKYFLNPIELVVINPINRDARFENAESGFALGVEIEAQFGFERFHKALRGLVLGGNLAVLHSGVSLREEFRGTCKYQPSSFWAGTLRCKPVTPL